MAVTIGEVRRRNRRFAFTVQFDHEAKPLEVLCDTIPHFAGLLVQHRPDPLRPKFCQLYVNKSVPRWL